jgi:hypothetical protein
MRRTNEVELEERVINGNENEIATYVDKKDTVENTEADAFIQAVIIIIGTVIGVVIFFQLSDIVFSSLGNVESEQMKELINNIKPFINTLEAVGAVGILLNGVFRGANVVLDEGNGGINRRESKDVYILTDERILKINANGRRIVNSSSIQFNNLKDLVIGTTKVEIKGENGDKIKLDGIRNPQRFQDVVYNI